MIIEGHTSHPEYTISEEEAEKIVERIVKTVHIDGIRHDFYTPSYLLLNESRKKILKETSNAYNKGVSSALLNNGLLIEIKNDGYHLSWIISDGYGFKTFGACPIEYETEKTADYIIDDVNKFYDTYSLDEMLENGLSLKEIQRIQRGVYKI